MMNTSCEEKFDSAAACVCGRVCSFLAALPDKVKHEAQEIRLRVNRPVTICCQGKTYFLMEDGSVSLSAGGGCVIAWHSDIKDTFRILCENSVYSHENEIRSGYIAMRGGHRAGICGTAVFHGGDVSGMKYVSSVNIRIAHEIPGCANMLLNQIMKQNMHGGLLIAGPPSSGKTTILRDIARQLSSGMRGTACRVTIVDERGEIAGTFQGIPQNDIGTCCDVLDGFPKAEGILTAVRSLAPQYIVCDEIGSEKETKAVEQSLNAGVCIIASIHAGSVSELLHRRQAYELLATGAFSSVALLSGSGGPGKIDGIYKAGDLLAEAGRLTAPDMRRGACGVYGVA